MESSLCEKCPVYNEATSKSRPHFRQKRHAAFWQLKAAAEDGCHPYILFLKQLESELEIIGQQYKTVDPDKIIDMRANLLLNGSPRPISACWTVDFETPSNPFVVGKYEYNWLIQTIELHPFDPAARSSKYDPNGAPNTNNFLGLKNW
jgi:hypothetical protein